MIHFDKITDIFCIVDEFCNDFENHTNGFLLSKPSKRPPKMSKSEVITIMIFAQLHKFVVLPYL